MFICTIFQRDSVLNVPSFKHNGMELHLSPVLIWFTPLKFIALKKTHRSDRNGQNVYILWTVLFLLPCVWLTWGTKLPWWQQGERSMLGGCEAPGSVLGSAEAAFRSNVLINDLFCHPHHCQTRWRCSWSVASLRCLWRLSGQMLLCSPRPVLLRSALTRLDAALENCCWWRPPRRCCGWRAPRELAASSWRRWATLDVQG